MCAINYQESIQKNMPVTPSFVLIALVTQYAFRIVFKLWKSDSDVFVLIIMHAINALSSESRYDALQRVSKRRLTDVDGASDTGT